MDFTANLGYGFFIKPEKLDKVRARIWKAMTEEEKAYFIEHQIDDNVTFFQDLFAIKFKLLSSRFLAYDDENPPIAICVDSTLKSYGADESGKFGSFEITEEEQQEIDEFAALVKFTGKIGGIYWATAN